MRIFGLLFGALIGVAVFEQPSSAQSLTLRRLSSARSSRFASRPAFLPYQRRSFRTASIVLGARTGTAGRRRRYRGQTRHAVRRSARSRRRLDRRCCCGNAWIRVTLEVTDRVVRWTPAYPETDTTIGELLSHTAPDKTFHYDAVAAVGVDRRHRRVRARNVSAAARHRNCSICWR